MISPHCLSALLFRDRLDRLGSLILAGYAVDQALESVLDRTSLDGPKPLSGVDVDAVIAECRAMVDDPRKEHRIDEYLDAIRRCSRWHAEKVTKGTLSTLARAIDGRWRNIGDLRDLLLDTNVVVDMGGIVVLRWRSYTFSQDYDDYLDEWRPRMPPQHGVGLREIDEIEADFNMVETYLVYTVPFAFEHASSGELQVSFRPQQAALVSRRGGVPGRRI